MLGYTTTLGKAYTADEMADMIGDMGSDVELDPSLINMLYYDYFAGDNLPSLTLGELLDFVNEDIASDELFAESLGGDIEENLDQISKFADKETLTKPMNAKELAGFFGMEESDISQILLFYYTRNGGVETGKMTLHDFADFLVNEVASDEAYASMIDESALSSIKTLAVFTDVGTVTAPVAYDNLAAVLGMEPEQMKLLYVYYYAQSAEYQPAAMTLSEFVQFIQTDIATNPAFASQFDDAAMAQMGALASQLGENAIPDAVMDYTQMAAMTGMDASQLKILYVYHDFTTDAGSRKLSLQTVVNFLVNHAGELGGMLGAKETAQMAMVQAVINASVSGTEYTSEELAGIVGMDAGQIDQLYLLYSAQYGDTSGWKLSVQEFVDFLVSDVLTDEAFAGNFDEETADSLETAQTMIDAVLSEKAYTPAELTDVLSGISEDLDANTIELLYLFYAGVNNCEPAWALSIEQLFDYLTENILHDPRFASFIDEETRNDIDEIKAELDDGTRQMKGETHSLLMLDTSLAQESEETSDFLAALISECDSELDGTYYLIGNSPMNYEMEQEFDSEMLQITLLTAIAIFLVVAVTFHSISVPLILVLIVQCGVYITISASGIMGYSIYYLAMLIVQCILMGATIDYGILFTNYYRENRKTLEIKDAIEAAYNGSSHTILTSGMIMVFVTGVIGISPASPTISQICQTIAIGTLSAVLLILFVLPGMLAAFDRFVVKKRE